MAYYWVISEVAGRAVVSADSRRGPERINWGNWGAKRPYLMEYCGAVTAKRRLLSYARSHNLPDDSPEATAIIVVNDESAEFSGTTNMSEEVYIY